MPKALTTQIFIERALLVHKGKFDYSKVEYTGAFRKVLIICPKHGEFYQRPVMHLQGDGCLKCSTLNYAIRRTSDTETYVNKAKQIHQQKYDYSKTKYISADHRVTITCPEHGDFEQLARSHLSGFGCSKCKAKKASIHLKSTRPKPISYFLTKALKAHGDLYDYSLVNYINMGTKIKIVCKFHGVFEQLPASHVKGHGCLICRETKGEKRISGILTKENIPFTQEYKIPNNNYRYDFYLPDKRLIIEYHGVQHYEAVEFFGGLHHLTLTRARDSVKRKLAESWGYRYLVIKYTDLTNFTNAEFEQLFLKRLRKYKDLAVAI